MAQEDALNARREFARRAQSYYRLRATYRVVGAAAGARNCLPSVERFEAIRDQMRELSAKLRAWEAAALPLDWRVQLEVVDHDLAVHADEVRTSLPGVELARLRAVVPAMCQTDRGEVTSFLDLCLADAERFRPLTTIVEYLVTVLSTEEHDGRMTLVCDPTGVTSLLSEIMARNAAKSTDDIHRVVSEAIAELQSDEVYAVLKRMRSYKQSTAPSLLIPGVLRAIVDYNIAAGIRIRELVAAERLLDDEECSTLTGIEVEVEPDEDEPEPASGGDGLAGLIAVEAALRSRVLEQGLEVGPAGAVASTIDVSLLSPFEKNALSSDDRSPVTRAVQQVVLLGLLLRHRRAIGLELAELGIDLEDIENTWVPEAKDGLRRHISSEIAKGRYKESQPLADVLSRYLPAGTGARRNPAPSRPAVDPSRLPRFDVGDASGPTREPARSRARRPARARRGAKADREGAAGTSPRQLVLLGISLVVIAFSGLSLIKDDDGMVTRLEVPQLTAISPYLESAARDGHGSGGVVVGTFNASWLGLDQEQRAQHTEQMARSLAALNVRKAMFFDEQRRLQLQYSNGAVHYLKGARGG